MTLSPKTRRKIIAGGAQIAGVCLLLSVVFAPQALAFPYKVEIGRTVVYSETPIPAAISVVLARADARLHTSGIYGPGYGRRIFLTSGGWRWTVLSFPALDAFAQTRPLSEPIVVNRSDVAADRVFNGAALGGERSLSGVIAHERAHGLIRAHFGLLADLRYPAWLREGYCDVVAGESSLSPQAAEVARRTHAAPAALFYFDGRRRVEALLRRDAGSVDRLFHDVST